MPHGRQCRGGLGRGADAEFVDVVVCDVVLGESAPDGIDLIPQLRDKGVHAPVVLVTAFADTPRLKRALNAGVTYLLEKPFRAKALLGVLSNSKASRLTSRTLSTGRCRARGSREGKRGRPAASQRPVKRRDRRGYEQQRQDQPPACDCGVSEDRRDQSGGVLSLRVPHLVGAQPAHKRYPEEPQPDHQRGRYQLQPEKVPPINDR